MKALGVLGLIVSVISISLGLHLHLAYAKAVDLVNIQIDEAINSRGLDFVQSPEYRELWQLVEFKTTYGILALVLGSLSMLMCIFPAVKNFKIAWVGVLFGLITFIFGAIHGVHLFE